MKTITTTPLAASGSKQLIETLFESQLKKVMVLILLTAFAYTGFAQFGPNPVSVLNLRMTNNDLIKVYLDGMPAGDIANRNVLNNLSPGRHYIQVYRVGYDWGYESLENAYRGFVTISPNTETFATVNRWTNQLIIERVIAFQPACLPTPNNSVCQYPVKPVRVNFNPNFQPQTIPQSCPIPVGPSAMNGGDFQQLINTIKNGSFESTRLIIFKQALAHNYFTTNQVCEVMNQFWFESSKLEVAKLAYSRTVDQQNYYLVNNAFSFSSSANNLSGYLAMQ